MKIAQVVSLLPSISGVGVVAHKYAEHLTRQGHEVTLFTPRLLARAEKHSYRVINLWPFFRYRKFYLMPQLLWRLWNYDVVHLHLPFLGGSIFINLLKLIRHNKIKLIVSYHWDVFGRGWRKHLYRQYNKYVLPLILNSADKVIVSSFDYIEDSSIRNYFFEHRDNFAELPFGVDENFSPGEKNPSLMKKFNFSFTDTILGFVGTLDTNHYFKGVNYLITALSKINRPDIRLVIVGDGNLKKKYQDLAKKLGIIERITFAGYVSRDLLPEYYNLFDLFVLPSIDKGESFGLVLLEAMACGKPLVASNLKGVRAVAISGENSLLVEPQNPRDIADKILYLLDNKHLYEQFRAGGLKLVEARFRWPKIVEKLLDVYDKC